MDEQQRIRQLFDKFIYGQCNPAEVEEIIQILKTTGQECHLPGIEEVRSRLSSLPTLDPARTDKIFKQLIGHNSRPIASGNKGRFMGKWQLAAALTGILLLAGIFYRLFFVGTMAVYATNFGETQTIHLPDGSVAMLNANSELKLAKDWKDVQVREVWLSGEAFFSVNHLPDDRKLIVHTSEDLEVEVLGTKFNVQDRKQQVKVVLNSGKVKVRAKTGSRMLERHMEPGEMLAYEKNLQSVTQQLVDTTLYTSWRDNLLLFKNMPLEEVAKIIENNFGYQVKFEQDELSALRFTGSNPADDLSLLLNTLSKSFNLQINVNQQMIIISNNSSKPASAPSGKPTVMFFKQPKTVQL